jgi:16S rRNA (adenine1518-N6/adenine1519-N6)-dimethyltransferase
MPKKYLSQNFLFKTAILKRIIEVAQVDTKDTVIEIGPGPGSMSKMLAHQSGKLIAIELDKDMIPRLRATFVGMEHVTLVEGDALKFDYSSIEGPFKVVANIPYHITTPLIFKLLEHRDRLTSMTLTVQKEVAQRIAAAPGNKSYGVLSIMVQYHGIAQYKFVIPAKAFKPVPKVDSACLHLEIVPEHTVDVKDEQLFFAIVRAAFNQRRKTLHNALKKAIPGMNEALTAVGVDPKARAETLSVETFAAIANEAARLGIKPAVQQL